MAKEEENARTQEEEPERSGQHTQHNARIGMHSKPSLSTPGHVLHTVRYDAILLLHGIACANFSCAGEARARKPLLHTWVLYSRMLRGQPLRMRTREHRKYRSTNDSVIKSERSSLVRGSDLPKCQCSHVSR